MKTNMAANEHFLPLMVLFLTISTKHLILGQTYSIVKEAPADCDTSSTAEKHEYFDISQLSCIACAQTSTEQTASSDGLRCVCQAGYKLIQDFGGGVIECEACPGNTVVSGDDWECVECLTGTVVSNQCPSCPEDSITVERDANGSFPNPDAPSRSCTLCDLETHPSEEGTRCTRCNQVLSVLPTQYDCNCPPAQMTGGLCFSDETDIEENVIFLVPFGYDSHWLFNNLKAAHAMCKYNNLTACQALGNMCVMLMYDRSNAGRATEKDACSLYLDQAKGEDDSRRPVDWPLNMPWLYYEQESADQILADPGIANEYTFPNSKLEFVVAAYSSNGTYLGQQDVTNGLLQLCKNTQDYMDAAYTFGTEYTQTCQMKHPELFGMETVYYDMYLKNYVDGSEQLYAIPILVTNYQEGGDLVNQDTDRTQWKLFRRFFMVDTVSGFIYDELNPTPTSIPDHIWVAQSISINIELQQDQSSGLINPPYMSIGYHRISYLEYASVDVSFSVKYHMTVSNYNNDIGIAVGVLSAFAIIYSVVQTWSWNKRAGQLAIDFLTVIKFLVLFAGNLANVFFVVTFGSALWWWIFYKRQNSVFLLIPSSSQENQFIGFLASAFVLKLIQLVALIISQVTIDLFFIDWERPRGKVIASNDTAQKGQEAPVSIWRTYFVANEWNEIQTTRKINNIFQVFVVVFFLNVVGFENLATADPQSDFNLNDGDYHSKPSRMMRYAVGALCWLLVALVQWMFYTFIYERFIEDKIRQYVDLCSMSNVSVFIMENGLFGYYIHGRSVHGRADTGLREMSENMKREEEDLCGQRGLMPNTEQQTFQMALPRKLRTQYDKVMMPIAQPGQVPATTRGGTTPGGGGAIKSHLDDHTEKCVAAYSIINRFLQAFVDHSLKSDIDYFVKDKNLLENIISAEFQDTTEKGHFFNDNGHSFDQVLFFGHETTLTIFAILFFSIVDLIFQNFVLAAVCTYLLEELILMIRDGLGRSNLAKKTLVDKRFLI